MYVELMTCGDIVRDGYYFCFGICLPSISFGKKNTTDWGGSYRKVGLELPTKWLFDIMPRRKLFEFCLLGFGISISIQEGF